jgi:hypothetical protein
MRADAQARAARVKRAEQLDAQRRAIGKALENGARIGIELSELDAWKLAQARMQALQVLRGLERLKLKGSARAWMKALEVVCATLQSLTITTDIIKK